jgi:hypothetical protein
MDQRTMLIVAAVGVAALAAVAIALATTRGGGGSTDPRPALEAAGCTLTATPALRGVHSITKPEGTSKLWNTVPPSSGPHYPVPAIWGIYDQPVNQAQLVHNLEHGGVAVEYGPGVSSETVQQLKAFAQEKSRGTILTPYAPLGDKVALVAWVVPHPEDTSDLGTAYVATCTAFDEKAFEAFFDAYQFKGPERFPPDQLLPGRQ